jgi:L-seryl-tRNA(Ser) seleniumtransferase
MQPNDRPSEADALKAIPAVSRLQATDEYRRLAADFGEALAVDLLREDLASLRERARSGALDEPALRAAVSEKAVFARVAREAAALLAPSPRLVINATGIVVHTNLGRSLLSEAAARRVAEAATAYMDLEYEIAEGRRGKRSAHLDPLLARLFPGRAAAAFNNNAAAILIVLRALARGKDVVVSRGELVEIGGSFRVPEILSASGARLREVGTTNRTRVGDYEEAIGPRTGLLLKVHTSNFRIVGFTEEATVSELAELARKASLPLAVDWGSGDLVDLSPLGIRDETPVGKILDDGADLVTFSGDKLLGGPQAGIVVGRSDLVARIRKDPMARVCRLDRILVCALRETLASYVRGRAFEEIPTLRMLALTPEVVGARASTVAREVERRTGISGRVAIADGVSRTGGGSSPVGERPTRLLAVSGRDGDAAPVERALRRGEPPVLGRLCEGSLLLDLRTVLPEQDSTLADRLAEAIRR